MYIKNIPIVISLEELMEEGGDKFLDSRTEYNIEYLTELRDIVDKIPKKIVHLGQKKVDGYPLTSAERKQLQRFREQYRNGKNKDKY